MTLYFMLVTLRWIVWCGKGSSPATWKETVNTTRYSITKCLLGVYKPYPIPDV